jgi:hypothetical protein
MKATWEKIDKNVVAIDVEVDAEKVAEALDKAFKKVVAKVNVPGFRKGKVPRAIFEARFGVESLYQDAIDIILPDAYADAVKETGVQPVDRPEIDVEQFGKGQAFKFKAKVTVKPEVKLGEYKGLEVPAGLTPSWNGCSSVTPSWSSSKKMRLRTATLRSSISKASSTASRSREARASATISSSARVRSSPASRSRSSACVRETTKMWK